MRLSDEELRDWAASSNRHSNDVSRAMARELLELRQSVEFWRKQFDSQWEQTSSLGRRLAAAERVVETVRDAIKGDGCVGKGPCMNATCMALEAYDAEVTHETT